MSVTIDDDLYAITITLRLDDSDHTAAELYERAKRMLHAADRAFYEKDERT